MAKHILITGGAGFIGSRLALELMQRGHKVCILDTLAKQIHGEHPELSTLYLSIKDQVKFVRGSVTKREDLLKVLPGVDTVVHLAAETGTGQSMYAIQHYSDVNIGGTALLLDMIANEPFPVKKIIVASSRAVCGEGKYRCEEHGFVYPQSRAEKDMKVGDFSVHCPICDVSAALDATDEYTPVSPTSVYGITKLNQEQMVLTVAKSLRISALAYRYQNVYGPGQSLFNPYTGILSIFSTRIRNGSDINIFEDGKESRDFVFIDDVIDATVRGIEYDKPIVDLFNVGSGVATDVLTIVETLQNLFKREVNIDVSGQFRLGDIRHNYADLTKIKNTLGFEPTVLLEDGLKQFVDWVQGEAMQADRYEQSLKELKEKGLFK